MESIEDFFKNRISFTMWEKYIRFPLISNLNFWIKKSFYNKSKIYNPLSLNITNTFDLVEKLTPLLYYGEYLRR